MAGFIELAILVFALAISFAVYLVHKVVREKETGLLILSLVLFVAAVFLTAKLIIGVQYEDTLAPPETVTEIFEEVTQ